MTPEPARSWSGRPTAEPAADVLVLGGGVIGTSIAYHLARAGARVALIERGALAAGASGVAAGMLAPRVEAPFADAFFELGLQGRAEHTPMAAQLREEVGLDVELSWTGILRVARTESERAELERTRRWQTAYGLKSEWVEPGELGEREPLLRGVAGRLLAGGLWLPDEGHVRSPRLVQALARGAARHGARIREGVTAARLLREGDRVVGAVTTAGSLAADAVVLAAGVASPHLLPEGLPRLPVEPVKGQILSLRAQETAPRQVLWAGDCYLVPRVDGEVVVGATEEDGNADPRPTLAGIGALSEAALSLAPRVGSLVLDRAWAGLRPAAPDRRPIVGWLPGVERLMVATAHFRNGVLLGPLTGRLVADAILTGAPLGGLSPFGPERFLPPAWPDAEARSESAFGSRSALA